jgi:uncharacterized protein
MEQSSSRRGFLAAGPALPAARFAKPPQAASGDVKLAYRAVGKTGLKVTSLSFGCMMTPDASVIEHAVDVGIIHFDTARAYQNGNNERMVEAALKGRRQKVVISSKSLSKTGQEALAGLDPRM